MSAFKLLQTSLTSSAPLPRLSAPIALEEGRQLRLFKGLVYAISLFVLVAAVWAAMAPIKELAIAPGRIIPAGNIQRVQHLEGGIVAEILTQEGDLVDAGQTLIRLQPIAAESDLGQLQARRADLQMQNLRTQAILNANSLDLGRLAKDYPETAEHQITLYKSESIALGRQRATLQIRISQRESELATLKAQVDRAKEQVALRSEQKATQSELLEKGYTSRANYLNASEQVLAAQVNLTQLEGQIKVAYSSLDEARSLLDEFETTTARTYSERAASIESELAEVEQQIGKYMDRVERLLVRAPVHGLVHDLRVSSPGEVIPEGFNVVSIVPVSSAGLVAEVQLSPSDAGYVSGGDTVKISLNGFDPGLYGKVQGEVHKISATTFQREDGLAYYKVQIAMAQQALSRLGRQYPILPGMEVQAEIITGEKSVMRYLLKPIFRALDTAFTER